MRSGLSQDELRRLRNEVEIAGLVVRLELPHKWREGRLRFLCPLCSEYHTATNPRTNLARCFRCQRNFNPIDLVMLVERVPFLEAVATLRELLSAGGPGRPGHQIA